MAKNLISPAEMVLRGNIGLKGSKTSFEFHVHKFLSGLGLSVGFAVAGAIAGNEIRRGVFNSGHMLHDVLKFL